MDSDMKTDFLFNDLFTPSAYENVDEIFENDPLDVANTLSSGIFEYPNINLKTSQSNCEISSSYTDFNPEFFFAPTNDEQLPEYKERMDVVINLELMNTNKNEISMRNDNIKQEPSYEELKTECSSTKSQQFYALPSFSSKDEKYSGKNTLNTKTNLDEKILKKQQRILKNRQSAALSYQKKKEYVSLLEAKVNTLSNENDLLKVENNNLRSQLDYFKDCQCNRKPSSETSKATSPNIKKSTTFFAILLMVAFGSFQTFFSTSSDIPGKYKVKDGFRRSLLWSNENEVSNSKIFPKIDKNIIANASMCSVYVNETENMRLTRELKKWIEINEYVNITLTETPLIGPKFFSNIKESTEYNNNNQSNSGRKPIFKKTRSNIKSSGINRFNPMQLFNKPVENDYLYSKLLKNMHRKEDTFYVFSFNNDHVLLPASEYNGTSRPKISLMFSAGETLLNGKIEFMQIDCVVMNTSVLEFGKDDSSLNSTEKNNNRWFNSQHKKLNQTPESKLNSTTVNETKLSSVNTADEKISIDAFLSQPFYISNNIYKKTDKIKVNIHGNSFREFTKFQ